MSIEIKSKRGENCELSRFDLASLFDTVPADQDVSVTAVKIIELKRGRTSVRDRINSEKLQWASEGRTLAQKFAA